jgi:hypothetical protein
MPESRKRKKKASPPPNPSEAIAERMAKRVPLSPVEVPEETPQADKLSRDPAKEIPAEERYEIGELPEPASYTQVLVALSQMDPLAQEVMLAERIAAMPSQRDGGLPVNIPRMVRGPWAHQLRQLGVFCIPELATHELVAPDGAGMLINHTAGSMRKLDPEDIWEKAKAMNPELGELVDGAETPEQRREAMKTLASRLPADLQIAIQRLQDTDPEGLTPK